MKEVKYYETWHNNSVYLILFLFYVDREEYHTARTLWKDTHDASAVLPIFPKRGFAERKLLSFYIRNPEQHAKAIKSVSSNILIYAIKISHALFVFIVA